MNFNVKFDISNQSFEVDGLPGGGGGGEGADGFSPVVDIQEIENGHRVTITDKYGSKAFDVMNGKDGKTPVRGADYWTEADKIEIKSYVDEAILNGSW